jgi:hemin uptake protein HemP
MADDPKQQDSEPDETPEPGEEPRVIDAGDLFQGAREICLELDGIRYRLRITRRNKLILQK